VFVRITQAGDGSGSTGFRLQVAYYRDEVTAGLFDPFDEANPDRGLPEPELIEDFDDLSPDSGTGNDWRERIADSALIALEMPEGTTAWPTGADDVLGGWLSGGVDGAVPAAQQFQGRVDDVGNTIEDPEQRRGLAALDLDRYFEVAIVHAPGIGNTDAATTEIQRALVTHCEHNRSRFAVLDAAPGLSADSDDRLDPRATLDTRYGAFYYPWYHAPHPRDGTRTLVPPGGAVCGIYAQTDSTRGVWKAPANVVVAGAVDLEYDIDRARHELLNPRGVNCIRRLPGRGIRVWGARTLSTDPEWKYVAVRRLVIFLEHSIYRSTQWVAFEPNGPQLWARVKQAIASFLSAQWRLGALSGYKEEEAFSVSVGAETMTEDDILNGRLIVEIGIAPVRPAEFVIFHIFQKTRESDPEG
jgi:phage tail sheath protein FI